MSRSLSVHAVLLLALTFLVSGAVAAREQPSSIRGIVVDGTGAAVSDASVTVRTRGGRERTTTTDGAGQFVFVDVGGEPTTLTAAYEGFAEARLDVTHARSDLRLVLHPLPLAEAVTVRAPALTAVRTTTATRTDTPLRDVPQSVSVVTREFIAEQGMTSMAEIANYVPGLGMAQGEGHRDAPIFRGHTSTADFFVDGVRDDTQYLRDVYNVERIEVLKGPNGMIFGRGGVGGVINRVTRQASWSPGRELSVQAGSHGQRRFTGDVGHAFNTSAAARVTGLYENSDTYRDGAFIERSGVNPTAAFVLGNSTTLRAGYEFFNDRRTTDRGIPSHGGRPLRTAPSTFFGSLDLNRAEITVHALSATIDHTVSDILTLRNRTSYADYGKFYQNLVPGAVDASASLVSLSGYNSGTQRQNFFNQTDLIASVRTGGLHHRLVAGIELGRQVTDNLRRTAFFPSRGAGVTSLRVPVTNPTTSLPVEFRSTATDANNHGIATMAAVYAQDQIALPKNIEVVLGIRYDRFGVDLRDHRNGRELSADDGLLSPRLGVVYKPVLPLSVYASYALSYLPRAGEQLSSLSPSNAALDPEQFRNYEVGAKWQITRGLSFATAVYRLDRGNVVVPDPDRPGVSNLLDAQRTTGAELELSGRLSRNWSLVGSYAYQDAEVTRTLSAGARAGARLGQVPDHTFALWNRYEVSRFWGAGVGVISRSDSFVSTDNAVVLPGFTRVDAAVFFRLTERMGGHLNLENVFDAAYYPRAHNNNNITPGAPRTLHLTLVTRF